MSYNDVPSKICFAYLDGDYYRSIKDSLKLIEPFLSDKSTVVVDDYYNESLPGVKKAVDEWIKDRSIKIKIEKSLAIIHL